MKQTFWEYLDNNRHLVIILLAFLAIWVYLLLSIGDVRWGWYAAAAVPTLAIWNGIRRNMNGKDGAI